MRIIIVGAGKVGYQIANILSKEEFDVVVIEKNEKVIEKVDENLDCMTIKSSGLITGPLKELGVNKKDIIIAVTESDEGNMLICLSAKALGVGTSVARIRNPEYTKDWAIAKEELKIDYIINPEKSTAKEIDRILTLSPAGVVEDFAGGKVRMVGIQIDDSLQIPNAKIKDFKNLDNVLVAAIIRKGKLIIPKGDDEIHAGDTIYIVGEKQEILDFCLSIGKVSIQISNVMILGGGHIAYYLAESLYNQGVQVKIIEKDATKCKMLSEMLPHTLIINGDATDINLLKSEGIESTDAAVTLTGMDEENVLLSLLAKQLGVEKVVSKVSRINYISLVETIGIDAAITPSMITTSEIIRFIRGDKLISLFLLLGGEGEIMEFNVEPGWDIIGTLIKDINFPKDALIASIIRKDQVIIPHGNDILMDNDRVIVLTRSSEVNKVNSLFNKKGNRIKNSLWGRKEN